jgi:hypothetical protein
MAQLVTITSVTANTPVEIYYCNSMGESCEYVATVSTFPYSFEVPTPISGVDYVIKIIDTNDCVDTHTVFVTPTPTSTITPTITPTMTQTPTITPTSTITPTITQSPSPSMTVTPTNTQTPSPTPVVSIHRVGLVSFDVATDACNDTLSLIGYYTYISEASTTPVVGAKVYRTLFNGELFNPYNGMNKWILMNWGSLFYSVQINVSGEIIAFILCD